MLTLLYYRVSINQQFLKYAILECIALELKQFNFNSTTDKKIIKYTRLLC